MLGVREPQMLLDPPAEAMIGRLRLVPVSLAEANELVGRWHRHHAPVVGHRFSIAVADDVGCVHGAVIVGRPKARMTDHKTTCEVNRLVTDGTKNACSMLYAAAARCAAAMGYRRIQTFILDTEPGTSLRASGWVLDGETSGGDWNRPLQAKRAVKRTDQPMTRKQRWSKNL